MTKKHLAIDFESTWDDAHSVTRYGPRCYANHPDVEIYLVALTDGEQLVVHHPSCIDWPGLLSYHWVSHNAGFDQACYQRLVRDGIAPQLPADHIWDCSLNLAAYLRAPRSLAGACKVLLDLEVSKDVRKKTKGLTPADMRNRTATDPKYPSFYEEVCDYAGHDAQLCWKLWENFNHNWPEHERELSRQTYRLCQQGLPVDISTLEGCQQTLKQKIFDARKQLPWLELDPDDGIALSHKSLAIQCRENGIPCPKSMAEDSEDCQKWEEEYGSTYPWVGAMRDVRKSTTLLRKLESLERRTCNGTFYFGLKYAGAHTMRFSGDAGFNIQNMPQKAMHGIDLRALIRAPKGKKLLIMDLAQIEARVLPWIIGDEKTMALIHKGISVYEAYARIYHGWTGGELKKENPEKYTLMKTEVLGLGFGCGHVKYQAFAKLFGVDMDLLKANRIVTQFRQNNPRITALWRTLDNQFKRSVGGNFEMELPSGRMMTYFDVQENKCKGGEGNSIAARVIRGEPLRFLYGGLLCENLVQATARDIFVQGLLNLDRMGAKILFHVHDEVVLEVDEESDPEPYEKALCDAPSWAAGLPIGAESILSDVYTK